MRKLLFIIFIALPFMVAAQRFDFNVPRYRYGEYNDAKKDIVLGAWKAINTKAYVDYSAKLICIRPERPQYFTILSFRSTNNEGGSTSVIFNCTDSNDYNCSVTFYFSLVSGKSTIIIFNPLLFEKYIYTITPV